MDTSGNSNPSGDGNLITLLIDSVEISSCIPCAMSIASGEAEDAPATPGCAICSSTVPPSAEEAAGVSRYEEILKALGEFKASISHIREHMQQH